MVLILVLLLILIVGPRSPRGLVLVPAVVAFLCLPKASLEEPIPLQLHDQRLFSVKAVDAVSSPPLCVSELVVLVKTVAAVAETVNGDLVAQGQGHENLNDCD